ncbi:MAG: hypothetical protein A2644_03720 [Candidatus Zambryskibacteria bacterium RIFCSPHIGHO2_01_FULL_39_63]|nr:MAG: hypothetical protein A2644_03720 [Candidatus Zambryskibacteria bacterium RIFCSPHIGHO2_01_FULL_39_63]OHA95286.1 MAG: hypothetical protein A3B88_02260 [Candidatus Zambryskibacteria bacterium RIFCSPHIGHO2_02_FULL_39_19]OHA98864.1 MAG: hypothetical protein A3F20_02355 [Candidatus Zambryskibacteria bacterium RIFCSPHIGHO2_12_FULL_39_21]
MFPSSQNEEKQSSLLFLNPRFVTPRGRDISLDSKICQPQIFGLGTGSKNFLLKILYSAVRFHDESKTVCFLWGYGQKWL